jgi:cytochrome b6-f complex iron-sulfur subunit
MEASSTSAEGNFVPDMERRIIMNNILLTSVGISTGFLAYSYLNFFIPVIDKAGSGGVNAQDALGNDIKLDAWKLSHKPDDRELVQGLKGDATYLISTEDGVKDFAINAVCTHLGCVVPWNKATNRFECPCHGS